MNNIILQPKASQLACKNFANTILDGVKKETAYNHIDAFDQKYIDSLNLGDILRIWGIKENNTSKFKKMGRGDLVLFTANNVVEACGKVAYSFNSPELARFLWGQDEGQTWDNIYIIENLHNTANLPVRTLNEALGYLPNNTIQGFTVVSDKNRIDGFWKHFDYTDGILTIKP